MTSTPEWMAALDPREADQLAARLSPSVLGAPLNYAEHGAHTVGGYLANVLIAMWTQRGFTPAGDSHWRMHLRTAVASSLREASGGFPGTLRESSDTAAMASELISAAIRQQLRWVPGITRLQARAGELEAAMRKIAEEAESGMPDGARIANIARTALAAGQ